jgi:hypothetical protein
MRDSGYRFSSLRRTCARQVQMLYGRYGAFELVIAKFIPGLSFAAPPLSGLFQMRLGRFWLFDAMGALIWTVCFVGLGFVFGTQLTAIAHFAAVSGRTGIVVGSIVVTTIFIGWKIRRRKQFLLALRAISISPEQLKADMDGNSLLTIIDVRYPLDLLSTPFILPTALRIPLEQMEAGIASRL